jgi:hypothetical protein
MKALEVIINSTIKNHPLIEMHLGKEHWTLCPGCGFASDRYRSFNKAVEDFQEHLALELNQELGLTSAGLPKKQKVALVK